MDLKYSSWDGVVQLGLGLSFLEKTLFETFTKIVEDKGFQYLSVSTVVSEDMLTKQELTIPLNAITKTDNGKYLTGSAEQGILNWLTDKELDPDKDLCLWALNECYRKEEFFDDLIRCFHFKKLEQFFAFKDEADWKKYFSLAKENIEEFFQKFDIEYRIVEKEDPGYHHYKEDFEIKTRRGWIESHSLLYYKDEHSKRFGFSGLPYTIAATGIASPRILVPFVDGLTNWDFKSRRPKNKVKA